MPLNDVGLVVGAIRDGYTVSKVINAAAGRYVWQSNGGSGVTAGDPVADVTPAVIPASLAALAIAVPPGGQPAGETWTAVYGTAPDYQLARIIGGVWVPADAGGALVSSPNLLTYIESTDPMIEFVVNGVQVGTVTETAGLPKWTLAGILDPTAYSGTARTIAQRDALAPAPGWLVYVSDGPVNEYQMWDGVTWVPLGSSDGNNRAHLTVTAVAPVSPGNPSLAEIQAAVTAATLVDTLAYYTGSDTPTDTPNRVYWVDAAGVATAILLPSVDDWQLVAAPQTLTAPGKYVILAAGTYPMMAGAAAGAGISIIASSQNVLLSTAGQFFSSPGTLANPQRLPLHTRLEVFNVGGNDWSIVKAFDGRTEFANGAVDGVLGDLGSFMADIWVVDQTTAGIDYTLPVPAADNTTLLTVHNTGSASFTVQGAAVPVGGFLRVLWDGTAWVPEVSAAIPMVGATSTLAGAGGTAPGPGAGTQDLVFHADGLYRQVFPNWTANTPYSTGATIYQSQALWRRIAAGTSGLTFDPTEQGAWLQMADLSATTRVHLTNTAVAPAVALTPTVAEITAATGTNRSTLLYYTGTDTGTDPISYVYWVDSAGTVTELRSPQTTELSVFTADLTADAAHTHSIGDFGQTWNNLGPWVINQETAAFPGVFQPTTLNTSNLAVTATAGAGNVADLDVSPAAARLIGATGTEAGGVEYTPGSTRSRLYYTSTLSNSSASIEAAATGVSLVLGATEDLRVNTDPGAAGEVLTSQGPDLPPVWTPGAGSYSDPFVIADWGLPGTTSMGSIVGGGPGGELNVQNVERSQPFTATASGQIASIQLNLNNNPAVAQTAQVRLYAGNGTGGAVLGSVNVLVTTGPGEGTVTATFPAPVAVTAGSVYTVGVVRVGAAVSTLGWWVNDATDLFPGFTNSVTGGDAKMAFDIGPDPATTPLQISWPAATHLLGVGYKHVTVFDSLGQIVGIDASVDPLTGLVTIKTTGAAFDGAVLIGK